MAVADIESQEPDCLNWKTDLAVPWGLNSYQRGNKTSTDESGIHKPSMLTTLCIPTFAIGNGKPSQQINFGPEIELQGFAVVYE